MSSSHSRPAILPDGQPMIPVDQQPPWPVRGPLEDAAEAEVNASRWTKARQDPPQWLAMAEQIIAATSRFKTGVLCSNGAAALAVATRSLLHDRGPRWCAGRDQILVPDLTSAPRTCHGVRAGALLELERPVTLIPIDCKPDATADETLVRAHLDRYGDRVLMVVPASMYGSFPRLDRFSAIGADFDIPVLHDGAHSGAAEWGGTGPEPDKTLAFEVHGGAVPADDCGAFLTQSTRLAQIARAITDGGQPPGGLDHILPPWSGFAGLPAGYEGVGGHTAVLAWLQWSRAIDARITVTQVMKRLKEEVLPMALLDGVWLFSTQPMQNEASWPVSHSLLIELTPEGEEALGIDADTVRMYFSAEGFGAGRTDLPVHQDPHWRRWTEGQGDSAFPHATRIRSRGFIVPHRYLRVARTPYLFTLAIEKLLDPGNLSNLRRVFGTLFRTRTGESDNPPRPAAPGLAARGGTKPCRRRRCHGVRARAARPFAPADAVAPAARSRL